MTLWASFVCGCFGIADIVCRCAWGNALSCGIFDFDVGTAATGEYQIGRQGITGVAAGERHVVRFAVCGDGYIAFVAALVDGAGFAIDIAG